MGTGGYFDAESAAQRYARGRPAIQPQIVERIQQYLPLPWPVHRAIDVACGTGISTAALKPLAREIVGTDVSEEMIRMAPAHPQIRYVVAPAEDLPFPDGHFELLTLRNALHWLNAPAFFGEARRVLREGGCMAIYYHAFNGTMVESPAFRSWMRHVFLAAYPMPPRAQVPMPRTAERWGSAPWEKSATRMPSGSRLIDWSTIWSAGAM